MTKDELKNRISMELQNPITQQGFEIICKELAELEKETKAVTRKANEAIADKLLITAKYNEILNDLNQENDSLQKENAELKEKFTNAKNLFDDEVQKKLEARKQLDEAKEIIKELCDYQELFEANLECSNETRKDIKKLYQRAEEFLEA